MPWRGELLYALYNKWETTNLLTKTAFLSSVSHQQIKSAEGAVQNSDSQIGKSTDNSLDLQMKSEFGEGEDRPMGLNPEPVRSDPNST